VREHDERGLERDGVLQDAVHRLRQRVLERALVVGIGQNFIIALDFSGIAERLGVGAGDWSVPSAYKPTVVYIAVILLLLLRPTGLMRREA